MGDTDWFFPWAKIQVSHISCLFLLEPKAYRKMKACSLLYVLTLCQYTVLSAT